MRWAWFLSCGFVDLIHHDWSNPAYRRSGKSIACVSAWGACSCGSDSRQWPRWWAFIPGCTTLDSGGDLRRRTGLCRCRQDFRHGSRDCAGWKPGPRWSQLPQCYLSGHAQPRTPVEPATIHRPATGNQPAASPLEVQQTASTLRGLGVHSDKPINVLESDFSRAFYAGWDVNKIEPLDEKGRVSGSSLPLTRSRRSSSMTVC